MAVNVVAGREFLVALCDALGLSHVPVQKVVIEAEVNSTVRVYVKALGDAPAVGKVPDLIRLHLVEDVTVSDRGDVATEPGPDVIVPAIS